MKRNTKKGQVLQTIKEVRKTGIDIIGDVPWGTHFCQFYQTKEDLLDILVPYFKAGLENNEFCMWVTSEPLGEEEAKKAMRKAVPDFDQHLKRGQIEIVPHTEWYLKDGAFNLQRVLDAWVDKLTFTLTKGYDGMRVTGNTAWLEKRDWRNFADYEEETDNAIGNYRMMAICSYSLDKCGASEVIDVVKNHKFAVIKRQGEWALIESSERKRAEKETVQHTKNIEILSKAAIGFIELPAGGDIYRFIGVQLRELIENAVYILVNSFDQITRAIQARSLLADDQDMLAVSKTLGTDPMGMSFAVSEEAWNGLISGKLVRVPGGIHELSFGKIPKAACDALEKLAGTGDIFVMGFSKTGELYGSATIIMRKGCELKNRDAVEAFMHQTGVALQRKRAEEALRQSEERYRSLFDRSMECVYINDFEGNFLDANPKALELLGYQKEDILALNFKSLLTEDQIPIVMEVLKKIIETGSQKRLTEYRLKAKDGGFVYVETQASIIYHEGKPYAVLGIARDITERKRAEEEVSRQKTLLQTIFDNIPAMIAFYDPNGQIEMVNRALEKTLGWSSEEISEIGLLEKCYPDPHYREEVLKYMINAEPGWRDFRTTTKNHRTIDTTWSNVKCPDGFSIGIGQDITERKKAEQALRDSEEKHRTYVENAPDGIFITDSNGRYIDANRAACRMTGYSRDELLNMRIMDLALPDASPEAFESFEKLKANGLMHSEITIQRKDGSRMWASLDAVALSDGRYMGFCSDITERKQAEEELQRTYFAIDNALEGMAWLDKNFNYIYVNDGMCQMLGFTRDELLSLKPSDLDSLFPQVPTAELWVEMQGVKSMVREGSFRRKDGTTFPAEIIINHFIFKNEEYIFNIMRDITERKQMEEALREYQEHLEELVEKRSTGLKKANQALQKEIAERKQAQESLKASEVRYRRLFESAKDGILILDADTGMIVDVNPYLIEMLGFSHEKLTGKAVWEIGLFKDIASNRSKFTELQQQGYVRYEDLPLETADGRQIEVEVVSNVYAVNKRKVIQCNIRDITERKQAQEEALHESEERYRTLVENASDSIFMIDKQEKVLSVNKSAAVLIGKEPDEIIGKSIFDLNPAVIVPDFSKSINEVFQIGANRLLETTIIAGGEERRINVNFNAVRNSEGKIVAVMGIARDISELNKMEVRLMQAERLTAVGTLAYGIAHEYNNILAGMLGNAELGMGSDDPKEVKECFQIIMENCDRAKSITGSLLAFSRQRYGKSQRTDVTKVVETVLGLIERELEKQNIEVVRKFNPVPEITCDSGDLSEVFLNMITNARDAMTPQGGSLTIEIGKNKDDIEIVFTDTGCGIPDGIKSRIFEPFVTTKGALGQSEILGTGLGLFLSYGIIHRYRGTIDVTSKENKGSKFTIRIPISENQQSPTLIKAEEEKPAAVPQNLNILLVDDEKPILSSIKKFLEAKGHSVVASPSGKKGLQLFKDKNFDLVLSDVTMPDMDGLQLISQIRSIDKQVKVIALTGHLEEEKLKSAENAGADKILIKPFKNEDLHKAIGEVFGT